MLKQSNVQKIAAGRAHTACIISTCSKPSQCPTIAFFRIKNSNLYLNSADQPPQVIAMGFAEVGQLGIGVIEERPYQWPQVLSPLDKVEVKDIVSGMDHMIAIGARGDVYAWGLGGFGQLGSGTISNEGIIPSPQLVENIPPFASIFSGADHSGGVDGTSGDVCLFSQSYLGRSLNLPNLIVANSV